MKKLITVGIVVLCAVAALAESSVTNRPPRRRRPIRPSAGILECPEAIPSKQIAVFNGQSVLDSARVAAAVQTARRMAGLPLRLDDAKSPVRIDVVATDEFGALALYPEDLKAAINVKALSADGAAPDVVATRLKIELARTAYYLLGSAAYAGCLTRPIKSLAELDAMTNATPCAEATLNIAVGKRNGIHHIRYTTYERACQQGWAPPPTNEIQRVAWEKAKAEADAKPTNPIKIIKEKK